MSTTPAGTPTTREEFFTRERQTWEALCREWDALSEGDLLRPGGAGAEWSIKDLINHIAVWQEAAIHVVQTLQAGKRYQDWMNTDRFNQYHYVKDRDKPLDESRARLDASRGALLALLEKVPDGDLLDAIGRQKVGWWAKWNTYAHYEHHLADLKALR